MKINDFLNTIYLGDRWLEQYHVSDSMVKLQINLISRIRSKDGNWNYYNDENIEHGILAFEGVSDFSMMPSDWFPNDEICDFEATEKGNGITRVTFYIGAYNERREYKEVKLQFNAVKAYIIDPCDNSIIAE